MPAPKKQKFHAYPFWSPRFWHGMTFGEWMKFWAKNHFRSHPLRLLAYSRIILGAALIFILAEGLV